MEWHGYSASQEAQIEYLEHHSVKGMRWRNRKGPNVKGAIRNVTSYANSQMHPKDNVSNATNSAAVHQGITASTTNGYTANTANLASAQTEEYVKPDSSYKEAKKSKRFSFFSSILAKMKKLFGK